MAEIILKEVAKIVIVIVKSCFILVLAVMVTVQRSFSVVTNAVATFDDRWPAVILSADKYLEIHPFSLLRGIYISIHISKKEVLGGIFESERAYDKKMGLLKIGVRLLFFR